MHSALYCFRLCRSSKIPLLVLYSFIPLISFFLQFCALISSWLSGCCTDTCSTLNLFNILLHAHNSKHFDWNKGRFNGLTKDTLSFHKKYLQKYSLFHSFFSLSLSSVLWFRTHLQNSCFYNTLYLYWLNSFQLNWNAFRFRNCNSFSLYPRFPSFVKSRSSVQIIVWGHMESNIKFSNEFD